MAAIPTNSVLRSQYGFISTALLPTLNPKSASTAARFERATVATRMLSSRGIDSRNIGTKSDIEANVKEDDKRPGDRSQVGNGSVTYKHNIYYYRV